MILEDCKKNLIKLNIYILNKNPKIVYLTIYYNNPKYKIINCIIFN